jgi:glycosyltransferase involved in cell wall biosynthesis
MGLGTPLICSDIPENKFITGENAAHFRSGNVQSLADSIEYALNNHMTMIEKAGRGKTDILQRFNWNSITDQYIKLFKN